MKDFAAIDFETANFERCSVCSVGIVVVANLSIVFIRSSNPNLIITPIAVRRCMDLRAATPTMHLCLAKCGSRSCPTFKVCHLWRITARLMKAVCVRCSRFMAWIIPIISFTTRSELPDEPIPSCPIISFTLWRAAVVTN